MEYKAIYKCRLCGRTYHNGTTTGQEVATRCMAQLVVGILPTEPMAPLMTEMHYCGGGSLGLADFQGWHTTPPGATKEEE